MNCCSLKGFSDISYFLVLGLIISSPVDKDLKLTELDFDLGFEEN